MRWGKKTFVVGTANVRSIKGKIVSIKKIVNDREVDFAVISELNTITLSCFGGGKVQRNSHLCGQ